MVAPMPSRQRVPQPPPNWKRLTIATFGIFFCLAAFVLIVCELIMPAVSGASSPSPSGFNYGAMFGTNFFRPFGWIVAAALVILAPITLLFRAADGLGDRLREWVRGGRSNP
jgi:hypothetical protein